MCWVLHESVKQLRLKAGGNLSNLPQDSAAAAAAAATADPGAIGLKG